MDSSFDSRRSEQSDRKRSVTSCFRTAVTIITWIELILGLSAVSSAVVLNTRVPVLLYAFYGVYFGIFLWLLYSTCRSTYLQSGPLNYTYWICGGCTVATIAIVLLTLLTAPNSGEIAFISVLVFVISLVLFPFICAVFYCFLRGNFIMPHHMRSKTVAASHSSDRHHPNMGGIDEPDNSTTELQNGFHIIDYNRTEV